MNKIMKGVLFIIIFLIPMIANSQSPASLHGHVKDSETGSFIQSAIVKISELNISQVTDKDGSFSFENIESGNYTLEVNSFGYNISRVKIFFDSKVDIDIIILLYPQPFITPTIVVTDRRTLSKLDELLEGTNVLKGRELQQNLGLTLAATLKNETGLSMRSMGPAPSRPVIRGLSGDRVFISEDGIKTSDLSSTSPDHSVTVEPFTVERIEVLRGPKILLRSPNAFGGVVNIIRKEIPENLPLSITGNAGVYGETVNKGYLGSVVLNYPLDPFNFRGEISKRNASDINTPAGKLINTQISTLNYSLGLSFINNFGFGGISYREFNTDYGIPGGFVGAHPGGVDIKILKRHFRGKTEFLFDRGILEKAELNLQRTYYHHREFENENIIGAEFEVVDYSGSFDLHHKKLNIFDEGIAGTSFGYRDFNIGGFVFTSPSKSFNFSGYIFEEIIKEKFNLQFSARINFDDVTPEREKVDSRIGHIRKRTYNTFSLSLSAIYEVINKFNIGFNVSRSSRVPTIEELYSEGPHLAAYSYEIGNPDLEAERGIGLEAFIYYNKPGMFFMLTGFRNDFSYYIIPRNSGMINFQTLLPIYIITGVPALMYGVESQLELKLFKNLSFSSSLSYTNGEITGSTKSPLPSIPPLKFIAELKYNFQNIIFGANTVIAAKQDKVDEFEDPTEGYNIYNAFFQYLFYTKNVAQNISLSFENIFNTEYRNHLSRIKSISPEAGRNLRLTYRVYF
jgi:iron complex outermembrane recepter protein